MSNPNDPPRSFTGHGQLGNWNDPANWDGGVKAPRPTGDVVIPVSTTMNGAFTSNILMLLGQETVTVNGALTVLSPGLCVAFMICDNAEAVFTPTSSLTDNAGGVVVGQDKIGRIVLEGNATNRATVTDVSGKVGVIAGSHGNADISGGIWNNTSNFYVGLGGNGVLTVENGGALNVGTTFVVGANTTASGQVTVATGGQIHVGTDATIGGGGPNGPGGQGSLVINATAQCDVGGSLNVGTAGKLTMSGGTVNDAGSGGVRVFSGGALSGNGTINAVAGGINDSGTITAAGGTLVLNGALSGKGILSIGANSTAMITGASLGSVGIAFAGSNAALDLAHGAIDHGTISGFVAGDSIVMAGVDHIGWNGTTDVLTLSQAGAVVDTLQFAGTYAGNPVYADAVWRQCGDRGEFST